MKLLGHALVARRAYPEGDPELMMLGSVIPEIIYYTKKQPFKHSQIHEGGLEVYRYLKSNKPDWADLGIGMITHSIKYGADQFNFNENLSLLGYSEKDFRMLRTRLVNYLDIDEETARVRTHNILELAVEVNIIKQYPEFVRGFKAMLTDSAAHIEAATSLAQCFKKDAKSSQTVVEELFQKATPDCFNSAEGLATLWSRLSKEFDPKPNKEELTNLLEELSERFDSKDSIFIDNCVSWVRSNLKKVL